MFKAIKQRNRWFVLLLAALIQPSLAMFYINRPRWGLIYLFISILFYPLSNLVENYKLESAPPAESIAIGVLGIALFLTYVVMVFHCFVAARKFEIQEKMPWYTGVAYVLAFISFILIVLSLVLSLFVRTLAYQPFNIPSGSMSPTLVPGDYLMAEKYAYGYSRYSMPLNAPILSGKIFATSPKRGDVVIFKKPQNINIAYVKRIVGLPGDTIQMRNGVLYINNTPVVQKPAGQYQSIALGRSVDRYIEILPNGVSYYVLNYGDGLYGDNTRVFKVPAGHYFVLGDNRDNATDSRAQTMLGFVPEDFIIARVSNIFWSGSTKFFNFRKMYLSPDK